VSFDFCKGEVVAKSVPIRLDMGHANAKLGHPGFLGGGTGIS